MYVSVRRYTVGAGSIDALARRIESEFAPAISQEPGFLGYFAVDTGDGELETISVFASETSARGSDELAAAYVAEHLAEFELTLTELTGGAVLASRAAQDILDPARRRRFRAAADRRAGGPVLVIGATGRTGRQIVRLLVERDVSVRALVRDAARGRELLGPSARLFVGDVRDPDSLAAAVAGAGAVVIATSGGADRDNSSVLVDYFGTGHVTRQAAASGVGLMVFISSIYATRPDYYQDVEPSSLGWKARAEEIVRASGVPYSIVRAGWLTDGPGGEPLTLSQGDVGEGHVSRADLAAVCAQVLFLKEARGKSFEVVAARTQAPAPLDGMIAALRPDDALSEAGLTSTPG